MAHFAQIDENDIVTRVLVIELDVINTGMFGDPTSWIQTSYNTRGGIHYDPNTGLPSQDQSKALRKNYAGRGYKYDRQLDAFIPPKPFPSWVLDSNTCLWIAPVPSPDDGKKYYWNEETVNWILSEDSN